MKTKKFYAGDEVLLASFLTTKLCLKPVKLDEDYWKLIGWKGVVIKDGANIWDGELGKNKFLIKFDADVNSLGLHCHNEVPNSLWISSEDLTLLRSARTSAT